MLGSHTLPQYAWRVFFSPPYLYAACAEAGVCIFETTQVGIAEPRGAPRERLQARVVPNPATSEVRLEFGTGKGGARVIVVRDVLGRVVKRVLLSGREVSSVDLNLSGLQAGLYFIESVSEERTEVMKLVKN